MNLLSILIPVLILAVIVYSVRSSSKKTADLLAHGDQQIAEVVTIVQGMSLDSQGLGGRAGNKIQMTMVLKLQNPDGTPRQATCTDYVDYANVPRPHDKVLVTVDRRNPDTITYNGLADNHLPPSTAYPIDAEALQRRGLAIATVKSVHGNAPLTLRIEIDSTIAPKREVTFQQDNPEFLPNVGERIYVFVAPDGSVSAVPIALTGGRRITPNSNRLDPLVLGPQILLQGNQARGTVTFAQRIFTSGAFARDAGIQRWHLKFHVVPLDQSPAYDAEQDLSFSTPERAAKVAQVGAQVELRVDRNDPHTIVTDSIAAGNPNPYPGMIDRWNQAVANGTANQL